MMASAARSLFIPSRSNPVGERVEQIGKHHPGNERK
jgi:hypothetical protein